MSKEQQELLDEVHENFIDKTKGLNLNLEINRDIIVVEGPVYNATPRLLSKDFVGITKGKVLVKENEKIFYVSKTDPRYLSGELKYFRTGQPLSDMQKMRISEGIKLRNSLLEKYYTVGSKWLHNNILKKNKQVSSDLYEEYIKNGWEKGRVKF